MVSPLLCEEYQVENKYFSSTIIEAVKNECGLDSSLAFAYFYFDFKDPAKQNYRNLICSLVTQLSWRFASIPSTLQELYSQNHNGMQQPTPEALMKVLKELCRPFKHTYIVLDALDECTGLVRSDVLGFIEVLVGWKFDNVHLLATSQKEPDIERRLKLLNCSHLDLKMTLIGQDIQMYVRAMLAEDETFKLWRDKEKQLIEETLMSGANGM